MKPYKQKIADYINNVLNKKRPELNDMATCPFAAPELAKDKLMIVMMHEEDKGIKDLLEEFAASDYDSALIALPHELSAEYREFLKINEKDKKSKHEQKKEGTQGSSEET
jgi:hypothetical protein